MKWAQVHELDGQKSPEPSRISCVDLKFLAIFAAEVPNDIARMEFGLHRSQMSHTHAHTQLWLCTQSPMPIDRTIHHQSAQMHLISICSISSKKCCLGWPFDLFHATRCNRCFDHYCHFYAHTNYPICRSVRLIFFQIESDAVAVLVHTCRFSMNKNWT